METRIYRLPQKLKATSRKGFLISVILCLLMIPAVLSPIRSETQLLALVCVLSMNLGNLVFCSRMLRLCNTYLEVTQEGIVQHAPRKPPLVFNWEEITKVEDNKRMKRLELRAHAKKQVIAAEYQVQDFDELRELIARKTSVKAAPEQAS